MSDYTITKKRLQPIEKVGSKTIITLSATADTDDWLNAGRLNEAAKSGDLFAADKLKAMQETKMVRLTIKEKKIVQKKNV